MTGRPRIVNFDRRVSETVLTCQWTGPRETVESNDGSTKLSEAESTQLVSEPRRPVARLCHL